ncbi:GNAT family N-acetyltransferase [Silvimonas iriomotensis]|uniref:Ribosomal-protein-serine acetyltransferase n=1 Tax=Silvimonas iriomotensis TaxID=449662 RepID=A0ABQ2P6V3_9NEIS|nr:GNAT family N-acetyltransferase [Silvimonas iriomotensis]GGP19452.1 ribosomal-protein-serine acetyltransferase [Silvimonas iriomotensis]
MASPLLQHIPAFIETERLLLRVPRAGDGADVHAAVLETLPSLRAFPASLPWAMFEPSVAASETWCIESAAAFLLRKDLPYLAFDNKTGDLVAALGLHRPDWRIPRLELGYWCRASRHGQGYVTEAARALLWMAFDTLAARRVEVHCDADNLASRRVCERLGMTLEGILRNQRVTPAGVVGDGCIYAIIR